MFYHLNIKKAQLFIVHKYFLGFFLFIGLIYLCFVEIQEKRKEFAVELFTILAVYKLKLSDTL